MKARIFVSAVSTLPEIVKLLAYSEYSQLLSNKWLNNRCLPVNVNQAQMKDKNTEKFSFQLYFFFLCLRIYFHSNFSIWYLDIIFLSSSLWTHSPGILLFSKVNVSIKTLFVCQISEKIEGENWECILYLFLFQCFLPFTLFSTNDSYLQI